MLKNKFITLMVVLENQENQERQGLNGLGFVNFLPMVGGIASKLPWGKIALWGGVGFAIWKGYSMFKNWRKTKDLKERFSTYSEKELANTKRRLQRLINAKGDAWYRNDDEEAVKEVAREIKLLGTNYINDFEKAFFDWNGQKETLNEFLKSFLSPTEMKENWTDILK